MYQVLLVDDEIAVTNSLRQAIDWESLGLSIAAVAMSGSQALVYVQNNPVDIVITDIRMADLDGLSLSQQIYQMNRNIQIIIISGFAEFSYAQKALSYGVIGYCLKPIEYSELTRYLQLAIHRLGHDSRNSNYDDLLDALHLGQEPEIRLHLKNLGFTANQYYVAVSVSRQPLLSTSPKRLTVQMGYKRYGYISTDPFSLDVIRSLCPQKGCRGFSCSESPVPVRKLGAAVKQLSNMAFQFFFQPEETIFTGIHEVRRFGQIHDIAEYTAADPGSIIALLSGIRELPPEHLTLGAAWHLYNTLAASDTFGPIVALDDIYSPEQLVFRFGTFQNMIDTMCQRLSEFSPVQPQENISNSAFLHMIKYIDIHLTDSCSLQQIAQEMNMNANYLGQVFKRETGKTYSAYVTELRIERAKKMLDSGDLSISDIASSLGFNDYFYFLKTFKRVTGVTPKQYRQRLGDFGNLLGAKP